MLGTTRSARSMLDEMYGFVDDYLADGGPLEMLEQGVGGPDDERLEFHGRPMFPERLHVVALAIDVTTQLLTVLDEFFADAAATVAAWPSTNDPSITPATRRRLEQIRTRSHRSRFRGRCDDVGVRRSTNVRRGKNRPALRGDD